MCCFQRIVLPIFVEEGFIYIFAKAKMNVRRHPAGGGNAHMRCI